MTEEMQVMEDWMIYKWWKAGEVSFPLEAVLEVLQALLPV